MNAVEIEEAISALAELPFDSDEFPYAFLEAFGNKETTLKRLRKGESNKSDIGGVLQTNNIHIATCKPGEVTRTLAALKASPATARAFITLLILSTCWSAKKPTDEQAIWLNNSCRSMRLFSTNSAICRFQQQAALCCST